jgi:hypothetical protein
MKASVISKLEGEIADLRKGLGNETTRADKSIQTTTQTQEAEIKAANARIDPLVNGTAKFLIKPDSLLGIPDPCLDSEGWQGHPTAPCSKNAYEMWHLYQQ